MLRCPLGSVHSSRRLLQHDEMSLLYFVSCFAAIPVLSVGSLKLPRFRIASSAGEFVGEIESSPAFQTTVDILDRKHQFAVHSLHRRSMLVGFPAISRRSSRSVFLDVLK